MDEHLGPGAVVMPQAASLHAMVVEFKVGHPEGFAKGKSRREQGTYFLAEILGTDGTSWPLITGPFLPY